MSPTDSNSRTEVSSSFNSRPFSSKPSHPKTIIVIGASVSGLATSALLRKAGHHVHMIERDEVPDCDTPLEAFEKWDRRGAPQVRHAHAFLGRLRELIKQHTPELLDRLLEWGADELTFAQMVPPTIVDPEFVPSDSEPVVAPSTSIPKHFAVEKEIINHVPLVEEVVAEKDFGQHPPLPAWSR